MRMRVRSRCCWSFGWQAEDFCMTGTLADCDYLVTTTENRTKKKKNAGAGLAVYSAFILIKKPSHSSRRKKKTC